MFQFYFLKTSRTVITGAIIIGTLISCHRSLSFDPLINTNTPPPTPVTPVINSISLTPNGSTPARVTKINENTLIFDTCKGITQQIILHSRSEDWDFNLNEYAKKYFTVTRNQQNTLTITTLHTTPQEIRGTLTITSKSTEQNPVFIITLQQKPIPIIDVKIDSISYYKTNKLCKLTSGKKEIDIGTYTAQNPLTRPQQDTLQLIQKASTVYLKIKVTTPASGSSTTTSSCEGNNNLKNYEKDDVLWIANLYAANDWINLSNITTQPNNSQPPTGSNNVIGTNTTLYLAITTKQNEQADFRNASLALRLPNTARTSLTYVLNIYQEGKTTTRMATP